MTTLLYLLPDLLAMLAGLAIGAALFFPDVLVQMWKDRSK